MPKETHWKQIAYRVIPGSNAQSLCNQLVRLPLPYAALLCRPCAVSCCVYVSGQVRPPLPTPISSAARFFNESHSLRAIVPTHELAFFTVPVGQAVPGARAYLQDQNKFEMLRRDAVPLLHIRQTTCRRPAHLCALPLTGPRRYRPLRCNR